MKKTSNSLYVIIVTYNATKWIDKCFAPFLHIPENWKVIAIDNASTDDTIQILEKKYPFVEIIKSEKNLGFASANNLGLTMALENNIDNVLLLNQDAWIKVEDIQKMIEIQNEHNDFYICSPLHFDGQGSSLDNAFSDYISSGCKDLIVDAVIQKPFKEIYEASYCNAAIWLLNKNCLNEIGGFNPSFFHYAEDDNYLQRLFYHNKKLGIIPSVRGYHDRKDRPLNMTFENRQAVEYRHNILLNVSNPNNHSKKIIATKIKYFKNCVKYALRLDIKKFKYNYQILSKFLREEKDIRINLRKSKIRQANFIKSKEK